MSGNPGQPPLIIDGLQYCNWSPEIFAQMRAGGGVKQHAIAQLHPPLIGLEQPGTGIDHGCLAAARWAEQRRDPRRARKRQINRAVREPVLQGQIKSHERPR